MIRLRLEGIVALAQGLWSGWAVFLAMGSLGIIEFAVSPSATISNYCTVHGYPKQQDYFWYFGTCVAGVVGVLVHRWWADVRMRRGWFHHLPLGRLRGLIFFATGTALLFKPQAISSAFGIIWLSICIVTPWDDEHSSDKEAQGDSQSHRKVMPVGGWILLSLIMSGLVVYDSCLSYRWIDGLHEGSMLLIVQGWAEGLIPGLDIQTFYGPLFDWSLIGWMKLTGMTVFAERSYYQIAQLLGTALLITSMRAVIGRPVHLLLGAWLILTLSLSSSVAYGASNMLRPGLAGAALLCSAGAINSRRPLLAVAAGLLCALAVLYSQEFGSLAVLGGMALCCGALIPRREKRGRLVVSLWLGGLVCGVGCVLFSLYGARSGEFIANSLESGYARNRLRGELAYPMYAFPWQLGLGAWTKNPSRIFALSAMWLPGLTASCLLATAALAYLDRERERGFRIMVMGFLTLAATLPFVVRPFSQIFASLPFVLACLVIAADSYRGAQGGRQVVRSVAVVWTVLAIAGATIIFPMWRSKQACVGYGVVESSKLDRLGRIDSAASRAVDQEPAVDYLKRLAAPTMPVFVAAPRYAHVVFLADRKCLGPYPTTGAIGSREGELRMLAQLELFKPPAVLYTEQSVDIPMKVEHPELTAYLFTHYRLGKAFGELQILRRRR